MLRAAIYGLGRWGRRLLDSVQDSDRIRITTGISRDPAKHAELAAKSGIRVVSSYARVLEDPGIDAVILATPHRQHAAQIVQAARAGRHVFVAKAFTLTNAIAERAIDACEEAGVTLVLKCKRRFAPSVVIIL